MVEWTRTWATERGAGGVVVVSFRGQGGSGSEGNADGERMREAVREALAGAGVTGLVIDLTAFEYRFGNWIGSVLLAGVKRLGHGRVCAVAAGETAEALRPLWQMGRLDQIVPILETRAEAMQFLLASAPNKLVDAAAAPKVRWWRVLSMPATAPYIWLGPGWYAWLEFGADKGHAAFMAIGEQVASELGGRLEHELPNPADDGKEYARIVVGEACLLLMRKSGLGTALGAEYRDLPLLLRIASRHRAVYRGWRWPVYRLWRRVAGIR